MIFHPLSLALCVSVNVCACVRRVSVLARARVCVTKFVCWRCCVGVYVRAWVSVYACVRPVTANAVCVGVSQCELRILN